ncbi:glycosyltransferase [Primorskyibacter aestuariivivens]|uniref:glycosyltransferase n=1 Tax=Primorskyibacter aestuariivivens TaxID=1888912 RepID=UPI002300B81B|nr:glycosyltransferase [Primorskyibacter aestuariivivens]MDA7428635.1 glycosyltransferase [Primorskyibacter aestuariivivens]
MRAAIVTGEYHLAGETFINRHIQHLFGGAAAVICGRYHGENPYDVAYFNRRGRSAPFLDTLAQPFVMGLNRMKYGTGRLPFGRAKAELRAFLLEHRIEVILAEFGTQALAMAPLAEEMGIPCFTYFRGTDASKALNQSNVPGAYRKMFPRLAGVFAVSQFLLDNLAAHGVRHDNAHVIPSGVNVRLFQPGEKRPRSCLAVGRMVEKKAPLVTLRAFLTSTQDMADAHLDFIGDGPLLDPAKALVAEAGAVGKVSFHGAQPHEVVREKLATTEFFLQHSITAKNGNTEGLPTAIQEAMACGCLTVSTRHAGIPEAIDEGRTGWLVEEHDEAGFGDAIRNAMQAEGRDAMAREARAVSEARFDNQALLEKLERVIRNTIAD